MSKRGTVFTCMCVCELTRARVDCVSVVYNKLYKPSSRKYETMRRVFYRCFSRLSVHAITYIDPCLSPINSHEKKHCTSVTNALLPFNYWSSLHACLCHCNNCQDFTRLQADVPTWQCWLRKTRSFGQLFVRMP